MHVLKLNLSKDFELKYVGSSNVHKIILVNF